MASKKKQKGAPAKFNISSDDRRFCLEQARMSVSHLGAAKEIVIAAIAFEEYLTSGK